MNTDEQQWYVQSGSRVQGPFSTVEVGRYLMLGRIRSNDRVSKDGELWEPVTQVPELIPEELLDLETDQGWTQYLESRDSIDERDNSDVIVLKDRRAAKTSATKQAIRDEWLGRGAESKERRPVSILPIALLGVTLLALVVVVYLNSMTNTPA